MTDLTGYRIKPLEWRGEYFAWNMGYLYDIREKKTFYQLIIKNDNGAEMQSGSLEYCKEYAEQRNIDHVMELLEKQNEL